MAVVVVLAVAIAVSAWPTALAAAACLCLALVPVVWGGMAGIVFPSRLISGLVVFNAAALLLGEVGGFYRTVWWWDLGLHIVSAGVLAVVGMAVGMMASDGAPGRIAVRMLAILAFGFAMMVGAMWELMEFALDATLGTNTQRSGLPDTMGDLAANGVGAVVGALAAHAQIARGARWPLAGLLGAFIDANPKLYPWRRQGPRALH